MTFLQSEREQCMCHASNVFFSRWLKICEIEENVVPYNISLYHLLPLSFLFLHSSLSLPSSCRQKGGQSLSVLHWCPRKRVVEMDRMNTKWCRLPLRYILPPQTSFAASVQDGLSVLNPLEPQLYISNYACRTALLQFGLVYYSPLHLTFTLLSTSPSPSPSPPLLQPHPHLTFTRLFTSLLPPPQYILSTSPSPSLHLSTLFSTSPHHLYPPLHLT